MGAGYDGLFVGAGSTERELEFSSASVWQDGMIESARCQDLDFGDPEVFAERAKIVRDYVRMADGILTVFVDVGVQAEIEKDTVYTRFVLCGEVLFEHCDAFVT